MDDHPNEAFPHPWKAKTLNYGGISMVLLVWLGGSFVTILFIYAILVIGPENLAVHVLLFYTGFIAIMSVMMISTAGMVIRDVLMYRRTRRTHFLEVNRNDEQVVATIESLLDSLTIPYRTEMRSESSLVPKHMSPFKGIIELDPYDRCILVNNSVHVYGVYHTKVFMEIPSASDNAKLKDLITLIPKELV